jgi:hypothetical protein
MSPRVERALLPFSLLAAVALAACGDSGPTSPTGSSDFASREAAARDLGLAQAEELEDFDCTHVENVRVRFSSPGWARNDEVGLYVFFDGLPVGPKRLRVWWDYEGDGENFADFRFPDEATSIEEVYEHRYLDLRAPTEMLVRVELIRDGLTGNCPRNRRVLLEPPIGSTSTPPAPATQTAAVGPGIGSVDNYFIFPGEGVRFTVSTPLTLDSVWVDGGAFGGNLDIDLTDSFGTSLGSRSVAVGPGPQQIGLGFALAPGDYVLVLNGGIVGLGVTTAGASYPYQIPGVISLTDSSFGFGFAGWYFFFYDWQVTW